MSKPNPQTQNQPNTRASSEPVAKGAASAAEEAAAGKHAATAAAAHGDEDDPTNCPICRYIEEGPCAEEHIAWRICKSAAKKEGVDVDWVERCTAEVSGTYSNLGSINFCHPNHKNAAGLYASCVTPQRCLQAYPTNTLDTSTSHACIHVYPPTCSCKQVTAGAYVCTASIHHLLSINFHLFHYHQCTSQPG